MQQKMIQSNLFEKVIVFSDLHLGLKHNSKEHNDDCIEFANWMVAEAKSRGAETCIFMGDFMHHRSTINSQTLDYALNFVSILNDNFKKTYFIVGNHDMFHRDRRDVTSTKFTNLYENIEFIDTVINIGDVAFIPWLINDEWKKVSKIKSKYIFGHLELPGFKMNAQVEMPDHGQLNSGHFQHQDLVFTGHFHARQTKGKITYIGNPFGHNYSDVWDFDRGAMFLEWGGKPEFINYEGGPRYININLSNLLEDPDLYLKPKTYLQVVIDTNITYEEALYLRELFTEQYKVRDFKLIQDKNVDVLQDDIDIVISTVDEIVVNQLLNIDSSDYDTNKLIEIYTRL